MRAIRAIPFKTLDMSVGDRVAKFNPLAFHWPEDRARLRRLIALRFRDLHCFVCQAPFAVPADACIDHDHETGIIRGLLCRGCNVAIGCLEDDGRRALRLGLYLAPDEVVRAEPSDLFEKVA